MPEMTDASMHVKRICATVRNDCSTYSTICHYMWTVYY